MNPSSSAPTDTHTPFTTAERIQQLSTIDTDIASLLQHTSSALRSIASPPTATSNSYDDEQATAEAALASFKEIQLAFVNTLDRIDKHLKRNIYALEEAGIITLRASDAQAGGEGSGGPGGASGSGDTSGAGGSGRTKEVVARLDPDGVGRYGSLDVGQLNMASSTVERDMEKELWEKARKQVTAVAEGKAVDLDRMEE